MVYHLYDKHVQPGCTGTCVDLECVDPTRIFECACVVLWMASFSGGVGQRGACPP